MGEPLHRPNTTQTDCAPVNPSLPTSCETFTIKESLNLEGENGATHDVGEEREWSQAADDVAAGTKTREP